MSQDRKPDKTVSFAGHKCEKLQKGLYDAEALRRISKRLETIIEELYEKGYTHFMYGENDKFGILAAEMITEFAALHPEITQSTIPDNGIRSYYNNLKYFIENSSVVVYCDGEKDEPEVRVMDKIS